MKRLTSLLAATVLGASLLTSCGGDGGGGGGGSADDYCDALKEAKADFGGLESSDFSDFDQLTDTFNDFADDAPDAVKDDWKAVADAFNGFIDALADAGVDPADLSEMQTSGQLPEGVTAEDLATAMQEAQEISSAEVEKALDRIQKHAKDECNVDLEAS